MQNTLQLPILATDYLLSIKQFNDPFLVYDIFLCKITFIEINNTSNY